MPERVPWVDGLENPAESFHNIAAWLVQEGFTDEEIAKVLGGNILRALDGDLGLSAPGIACWFTVCRASRHRQLRLTVTDPTNERVIGPEERMEHLLEEVARADQVGLDTFGIGEHHRHEFMDSAPAVILAAAAARTRGSASTAPWPCSAPPIRCGSSSSSRPST